MRKSVRINPDPSKAKPSKPAPSASQAGELVMSDQGQPITTTRIVSAHFGKSHKNVLRSLETIVMQMDDPEFTRLNFERSEYTDSTGRKLPEWRMSEQGFAMLALAFTGKKAVALRLQFVKAFAAATKRIRQLEREQADPAWLDARRDTKLGHALIGFALETTRRLAGKEVKSFHYSNEARLVANAMLGSTQDHLCRDCMGREELRVLAKVEQLNAELIAMGESYAVRKGKVRLYALQLLADLQRRGCVLLHANPTAMLEGLV